MNDIVVREFVHYEMNTEVRAISGYYTLTKEVRLPFNGKEIFYILGYAVFDTSCCGTGGCCNVIVPGFIKDWKIRQNKDDRYVSRVEPIKDLKLQEEIRAVIKQQEMVQEIRFE